ncbi:prenyltransferase [Jidongwangia harbinensis]|uniref:prenyltransferase n=1 Tax=Jidongwangia harbinensis TaxID=2878561 RepID=UPI001CD98DAC|nr:prenyltransferase [Jidongwangia harbinensis]MCA2211626.1 prenyltransferase [Jidongwangia harbinensis]
MTPQLSGAPATGTRSARRVAVGLLRLSKCFVYQQYYGWALVWFMLPAEVRQAPGTIAAMCWYLLGTGAIISCACAADDLVGFRNGSDAVNYRSGTTLRKLSNKPLLSGAVTERQARTFVLCAAVVAVLSGAAAFGSLGWDAPPAAYALYAAGFALSVQYSTGLRVSYHPGGGETTLWLSVAAGLLAPYVAVTGDWSTGAVLAAFLLGLWQVLVSSYSNVNDITGDSGAGRRTLAVTLPRRALRRVLVGLVGTSAAGVCALVVVTPWPWWTLLTTAPAIALHGWQLYVGPVLGDWLRARRIGFLAFDAGFLGLALPTFAVFHL